MNQALEQGLTFQVIEWMTDREAAARRAYSDQLSELVNNLAALYPPTPTGAVKAIFAKYPDQWESTQTNQFLYLPADSKNGHMVPVATMSYNFAESWLRFEVGCFWKPPITGQGPAATGYRYESPEGGGVHDFYHSQPTWEFRRGGAFFKRIWNPPNGISDSWPALPLDALSPLSLTVAMLVSIYGGPFLRELLSAGFGSEMTSRISAMHLS
jgi:hypothetical protein